MCSLYMGVTYKYVGKFSTFYCNNLSDWLDLLLVLSSGHV